MLYDAEDKSPTEGPHTPNPPNGDPAAIAVDPARNESEERASSENTSDSATPSALDAPTPGETTATTSTRSTPSNTGAPSPPNLWRSHESAPAVHTKAALQPDIAYALRRGSAPAPLGAHMAHPSPYYHGATNDVDEYGNTVTIWDGGTPPSPLSTSDDVLGQRRGSLPSLGTACRLPPIPADPHIRRMSLQRSKLRLAQHPYAWQVAAANGTILPNHTTSRYPARQTAQESHHSTHSHGNPVHNLHADHQKNQGMQWENTEPQLARAEDSTHGGQGMHNLRPRAPESESYRSYTEIPPGPLPTPNFSFGTAPAPIAEMEGGENAEEEDTNTGTSLSVEDLHRFGSFASVVSTDSSVTSAWYSDIPSSQDVPLNHDLMPPSNWQGELRRSSW